VGGNLTVGSAFSAQQYVENVTSIAWAKDPSAFSYTTGTVYYLSNNASSAITSLSISNLPTPSGVNLTYTFTFIINSNNNNTYYINPTGGTITINSTSGITLKGVSLIAGNLAASPSTIIQQITILYLGSLTTSTPVFTSAISY
jgi:hypothetical protein